LADRRHDCVTDLVVRPCNPYVSATSNPAGDAMLVVLGVMVALLVVVVAIVSVTMVQVAHDHQDGA
jgi:hypothetical protein